MADEPSAEQFAKQFAKQVRETADREAIIDLTHRYATALDTRDWALLETCFLPDGAADYGELAGLLEGVAAIASACRAVLDPLDASRHLITNHVVELDGDTARCHSYFMAQHIRRGCEGGENFTVGGDYHDDLVRVPEGWRIRKRVLEMAWREGNPRVFGAG